MYWNLEDAFNYVETGEININMRCIEISMGDYEALALCRLTLTWDVLKFNNTQAIVKFFPD